MQYELIIESTPNEVQIALLNDKRLQELHKEKRNSSFAVGDIHLGKVKKIMPGLNAVFIDVGYEKDAFLHYLDLGPQYASLASFTKKVLNGTQKDSRLDHFQIEPEIDKMGKIAQVLNGQQLVLVQIAKEPISSKGPRITSELSLAGRYIVLIPFAEKVSVSQKIKNAEERDRLRKILQGIKPKHFGIIVRTVAEGKSVNEIEADLKDLMQKWESLFQALKITPPTKKILGEIDRTSAILRDILNAKFSNIQVDEEGLFDEVKSYLLNIAPEKKDILKLYKGKLPIFEHFGIEKQIKGSFGKTVPMRTGAYLIIEHTEAMHVIDVNSGHRAKSDNTQELNALEVNMDAAVEVARQLRLRDMGGIIVVDFIDMGSAENRAALYQKVKDEMKSDRARHQVLPPTKFGLVQITRQRVRPEMNIQTLEKCPACKGSGEVSSTVLLADEVENNLRFVIKEQNEKAIELHTNPYLAAYFTKGIYSKRIQWLLKYKKWIKVVPISSYNIIEYRFFTPDQEEIKL
ncbi:MAG TPA: Rne/Rng family ribonuclease [Bacteroidia bacterium]|nr:Rne/Rng family ribonuclease [Bacteroidia bacterium]